MGVTVLTGFQDVLQDQLEEEKQRVKDLESRGVGPLDDDEIAQELQKTQEEVNVLNKVLRPQLPPLTPPRDSPKPSKT